jgi:hypothetical protein
MRHALFLICVLSPAVASADDDATVTVDDEGRVVARIHVPASTEEVRAVLGDTDGQLAALSPDTLSVQTTQVGPCEMVDRKTRGVWRPFAFRAKRCPTDRGWQETLVASDDFTKYEAEWELEATDHGTEVVYKIQTEINAPVPSSLVRTNLKSAASSMLKRLVGVFRRAR